MHRRGDVFLSGMGVSCMYCMYTGWLLGVVTMEMRRHVGGGGFDEIIEARFGNECWHMKTPFSRNNWAGAEG